MMILKWRNNREQDEFPVIFRDFSMDPAFAFCFCLNGISRSGKQLLLKPPYVVIQRFIYATMYLQHGSDYTLYISLPYNTRATKTFATLKQLNSSSTSEF